jgi:aminoglycoside 3-N-acetyltransferase
MTSARISRARLERQLKQFVVQRFFAYGKDDLLRLLIGIGVATGDTLMVHSSWRALNGFRGSPAEFNEALRNAVGDSGRVVMPSLTYHNMSSAEFLATGKPMDARRSPSAMGLLSEVFRRGKSVVRSLSPTHPLLVWGAEAERFIAGHELTNRPFGPESPFARLLEQDALILCVDTGFSSITLTHFVEDHLQDTLSVPLYEPTPLTGIVIDREGRRIECPTRVIAPAANALRREHRLVGFLTEAGTLHKKRLGNTAFLWIRAKDLLEGAEKLAHEGPHFFDRTTS